MIPVVTLIEWAPVVWAALSSRDMVVWTTGLVMALAILFPAYMAFRDGPSA